MVRASRAVSAPAASGPDRRDAVLDAAMSTFARHGYRKTSMDQVARDAQISRPGLYLFFATKQALFREAAERSLAHDLAAAEAALATEDALDVRLLAAFDQWAGRYIGPLSRDVATVIADNPDLLGPVATSASTRFAAMITAALADTLPDAADRAQTLVSTSVGIKHQVDSRRAYRRRLRIAIELLVGG